MALVPSPDSDTRAADLLEVAVHHLAGIERPSASPGEREAAEWIAAELRGLGCSVEIEEETAHGTYWWPLGLLTAAAGGAGVAGLRGGRRARALAALVGGAAAVGVADDVSGGVQWFRRRLLPRGSTQNVVARIGDESAERTVLLVAHHDAARSGTLFHPAPIDWIAEHFPQLLERTDTTPPVMFPVVGGPLLVALGAGLGARALLRAGAVLCLGAAATFLDVGLHGVVPGANDNLTGVATLLGVARALRERPVEGIRVLLVSNGAEESFMEGMQGFARRHFSELPVGSTHVVCVDTVGSPELLLLEGEGMLFMRDYPAAFKDLVSECARGLGVHVRRGLRLRNATDGLIALRAGYPTVMLGSVDHRKFPTNYHWPTDTPENVRFDSVRDAVRLCEGIVRRLAGTPG